MLRTRMWPHLLAENLVPHMGIGPVGDEDTAGGVPRNRAARRGSVGDYRALSESVYRVRYVANVASWLQVTVVGQQSGGASGFRKSVHSGRP
jgi:hypothetical protein